MIEAPRIVLALAYGERSVEGGKHWAGEGHLAHVPSLAPLEGLKFGDAFLEVHGCRGQGKNF